MLLLKMIILIKDQFIKVLRLQPYTASSYVNLH